MAVKSEKTADALIEKFSALEKKIIDILNMPSVDVEEKVTRATLKKNLSKYIKNVEEARALFDEYEAVALEIEKLSGKKSESEELLRAVVELREEVPAEDLNLQYKDEVQVEKNAVKVVKKKQTKKTREL